MSIAPASPRAVRIAVDAMGGDFAPRAIVHGALLAALEDGIDVLLVGRRERIERELAHFGRQSATLEILHAEDMVGMDETATA
ncbi:MAG: hypothetical protein K8H90_05790, partial [Thermoanaerobaculia bacterium]|nr:hypothetical protein [Thermoanaerobaculia bacterium]